MRTTVTLDDDVVRMIRDTMHRTQRSFKETLNDSLREALGPRRRSPGKRKRLVVTARPLGLRAGIDPTALNKLADELEVDAARAVAHRSTSDATGT